MTRPSRQPSKSRFPQARHSSLPSSAALRHSSARQSSSLGNSRNKSAHSCFRTSKSFISLEMNTEFATLMCKPPSPYCLPLSTSSKRKKFNKVSDKSKNVCHKFSKLETGNRSLNRYRLSDQLRHSADYYLERLPAPALGLPARSTISSSSNNAC